MRVITGLAKGMPLTALRGAATRPTSDKTKEAIFSAIQFDVEGAVVLDLFAGSGQLGIEALSRGAAEAHFVDGSAAAVAVIKDNLARTGFGDGKAHVFRLPSDAFLRTTKKTFDVAFLDPPFEKSLLETTLKKLLPKMNKHGIIICEHEERLCLDSLVPELYRYVEVKVLKHGSCKTTIYRDI